ncbi:threonine/serine exporter family protein [Bacillus kwashiorkori]|uniref:threonine/serine exporter family protein n=1 Tax=Bacillus kwashiorkori TaxID=1522318 RepID=UPI0007836175|nr:threonine/serine exporter family protein [Bacillus kwashiorkori]
MLAQLFTSFVATSGFGVIFNVPKKALIQCGFVGMVGWAIYFYMVEQQIDSVPASFVAAFFISIISHIFAKRYKTPVIIFTVAGIIPLVPGGLAYETMRNFVVNDYNMGIQLATKVLLIAGAIAMGIVFSEVFNQIFRRSLNKIAKIKRPKS